MDKWESEMSINGLDLVIFRSANGITQIDLGRHLKVSKKTISRWECGRSIPSPSNKKLLIAFMKEKDCGRIVGFNSTAELKNAIANLRVTEEHLLVADRMGDIHISAREHRSAYEIASRLVLDYVIEKFKNDA